MKIQVVLSLIVLISCFNKNVNNKQQPLAAKNGDKQMLKQKFMKNMAKKQQVPQQQRRLNQVKKSPLKPSTISKVNSQKTAKQIRMQKKMNPEMDADNEMAYTDLQLEQPYVTKEIEDNENNDDASYKKCPSPFCRQSLDDFDPQYYDSDAKLKMVRLKTKKKEELEKAVCKYQLYCGFRYRAQDLSSYLVKTDELEVEKPWSADKIPEISKKIDSWFEETKKAVKGEACDCKNNGKLYMPIKLEPMIQQIKSTDPESKQSGQSNYFGVTKRVFEDLSDKYKQYFGDTAAETMSCYISYDINHLTLAGEQLGFEKFGPPYDFLRRARLIKDTENNYRIALDMKFGETNLFFAEMNDLKNKIGQKCESDCKVRSEVNYAKVTNILSSTSRYSEYARQINQAISFQDSLNQQIGQEIQDFVKGPAATYRNRQYCFKINKVFKILDIKLEENKSYDKSFLDNITDKAESDASKQILDIAKLAITEQDDNIDFVITPHRSCSMARMIGNGLSQ